MVAFRGGMPLGSLLSGWAANQTSAPVVLLVNGTLLALVASWFLVQPAPAEGQESHAVREL